MSTRHGRRCWRTSGTSRLARAAGPGRTCAAAPPRGRSRGPGRGARDPRTASWTAGASPRRCSASCTPSTSMRSGSTARAPTRASRASRSSARPKARSVRSSATTSGPARWWSIARRGREVPARACSTISAASSRACARDAPGAAVRLRLRLRRVPRLRAQGRVRRPAPPTRSPLPEPPGPVRPADRLRSPRAPRSPPRARRRRRRGGGRGVARRDRAPPGRSRASRRRCRRLRASRERCAFELHEAPEAYLDNIAACLREICEGESYEVCLTTELRSEPGLDAVTAYRTLRTRNPAPFAALLRLGELSVLSSSPERFLRVDRERVVESPAHEGHRGAGGRAVRGRLPRGRVRRDRKTRAENLMIADLVRNDLGRVCAPGQRRGPRPDGRRVACHGPPDGDGGARSPARGCRRDRVRAGGLPSRLHDRRAEAAHDGDHRPHRGAAARRLRGRLGFFGVNGTADLSVVIRTLVAVGRRPRRSVPAGRSSPRRTRRPSSRRCCSRRALCSPPSAERSRWRATWPRHRDDVARPPRRGYSRRSWSTAAGPSSSPTTSPACGRACARSMPWSSATSSMRRCPRPWARRQTAPRGACASSRRRRRRRSRCRRTWNRWAQRRSGARSRCGPGPCRAASARTSGSIAGASTTQPHGSVPRP